ncbi:MAG: putative rane protein [Pseudonocardiales bacterium]|nr:putative rane protein [Pseudonocardiales bacterium]
MDTWVWIVIIAAAVVIALVVAAMVRQRRTAALRQHFGPEYDRTVEHRDDRRSAEAELRGREKHRAQLDITPIPEATRARFAVEWRTVQEQFVDQPSNAVIAADSLLYRVMAARGYPMDDFEAQADLVSVDHPHVVDDYRSAHGTYERAQTQRASTEDLRQALVSYRSLFDDLLQSDSGDGDAQRSRPARHSAERDPDDRMADDQAATGRSATDATYRDHPIGGTR